MGASISCIAVVAPLSPKLTDKLEVIGKFNSLSRLPQYLHKAIFVGANACAFDALAITGFARKMCSTIFCFFIISFNFKTFWADFYWDLLYSHGLLCGGCWEYIFCH